tara:strand:- start:563 stop:2146 length:1584 start_codon:yes stop_codon:yes gene_type:complete
MKLIRLVSNEKTGEATFDNHFSTIINIEKDSKIALDTCVLDVNPKSIRIETNKNDEVRYQVSNAVSQQGVFRALTTGTYNETNIDTLISIIQNKLNGNLEYVINGDPLSFQEKAIGLEWFCTRHSASNGGKLVIGYNIAPFTDYLNNALTPGNFINPSDDFWYCGNQVASKITKTAIQNSPYFSLTKNVTDTNTYKIDATSPISYGGGNLRVANMNITTNNAVLENNGFMLSIHDEEGTWVYGIRVNRQGSPYQSSINGTVFTNLDIDVLLADGSDNSDVVELVFDKGDIGAVIYQNDGDSEYIDSTINVNYDKQYYGRISITGNATNCTISKINYSISIVDLTDDPATYRSDNSPAMDANQNTDYLGNHPRLTATTPPHPEFRPTANNFYLPADLMEFLGYSQLKFPIEGTSQKIAPRYVSSKPLELGSLSDNYIVQLNNIFLKSYDGDTLQENGQRRSILSLIPDESRDNTETIFDCKDRLFLDIDNIGPLNLNRLSISILDDNYEVIKLRNKSSLSVVIKSPNE